jgi:hypothetical protein
MVDCLVIFSFFIYQPDTIEAVHFTVVAHPKNSSDLVCPRAACLASHRNHRAGRKWDRERIPLLRPPSERELQFRLLFHGSSSGIESRSFGPVYFTRAKKQSQCLINAAGSDGRRNTF